VRTMKSITAARRPVIGLASLLMIATAGLIAPAAASAATGGVVTPDAGPVSHGSGWAELTPSQQGEQRHYWCGPAALVSTLKESGHGTYSQTWAAGVLGTTTNGTDMGSMLSALNKYSGGFRYDEVFMSGAYSTYVSAYESHLITDINSGNGVVGNAYEVPGGPHLAGHPNETIFHYIAIDGYGNSGASTHYADPATTVWSTVPAYSNISSSRLMEILQGRGYFW
jgi:hypothetical protein